MTIDEFISELTVIQERLISMPEEEALTETFANEQKKLTQLIETLTNYTQAEQDTAREKMREFADKLNLKLAALRNKMEHLSQDISFQHTLQKGMKAYAQDRKLF